MINYSIITSSGSNINSKNITFTSNTISNLKFIKSNYGKLQLISLYLLYAGKITKTEVKH